MSPKIARLSVLMAAGAVALPSAAAEAAPSKGRYTVRLHVEMAEGRTHPIYAGDPLRVSLRGRGHGGEHYELCWAPAPVESAPCTTNHRVNGTGRMAAPEKGGLQKLRFKILETGKVIVRRIRIVDPRTVR